MNLMLRVLGITVFSLGILLAINPELISRMPVPESTFEAVERRVLWGTMIGLGMLLVFLRQFKSCISTLTITGCALISGTLMARIIGIILNGSDVKQCYWVAIELIILAVIGLRYIKKIRNNTDIVRVVTFG